MSAYSARILALSPTNYYRLGEATGIVCADSSGNAQNGAYLNTPTLGVAGALTGDPNTAVTFDGLNQAADLPSITAQVTCSVSLWMKGATSGTFPMWSNRAAGGGVFFGTQGVKCLIYMDHFGAQAVASVKTVVDSQWHNIVWTNDGITSLLYIDGVFDNSASNGDPRTAESGQAWIAYDDSLSPGSQNFTGTVDEVAVFASVISPTNIAALYRQGITNPLFGQLASQGAGL